MKKKINIRNSVIIFLSITIVFMAIGFIVLSIELKKEKDKVTKFDVSFTSVKQVSSVKGGSITPVGKFELTNNNKEVEMNFTLNSIHDELSYVATIKNNGTLPAEIVDIVESPDYNSDDFQHLIKPVTINLSDIKGKIVPAGEEIELKIIVYYNPSQEKILKKNFNYKIGLITKSR